MCFRPAAIEVPAICPECGAKNPPTNKKCRSCGIPLEHVIADNQDENQTATLSGATGTLPIAPPAALQTGAPKGPPSTVAPGTVMPPAVTKPPLPPKL